MKSVMLTLYFSSAILHGCSYLESRILHQDKPLCHGSAPYGLVGGEIHHPYKMILVCMCRELDLVLRAGIISVY